MRVLSYSEVLMRLNPQLYERLEQAQTLDFSFTGTGFNFLVGLEHHGFETELLSVLPDNRLGDVALSRIQMHGVGSTHLNRWGSHMGSYIIELGFGVRPSQVTYLNRSMSSFNQQSLTNEQMDAALDAVDVLHICGIALSTSTVSMDNACSLVRLAKTMGKQIIFDFNFRPSLNEDISLEILKESYAFILSRADIVFGSKRDISRFMVCETDAHVLTFMKDYDIQSFAGTLKGNDHDVSTLQGKLYDQGNVYVSDVYPIQTLDRIGTGDAFASALVATLLKNKEPQFCVDYASVASQLSFTTLGDIPLLSESFILEHMSDPKDVIR